MSRCLVLAAALCGLASGGQPAHVVTIHANAVITYTFESDVEGGIHVQCKEDHQPEWKQYDSAYANIEALTGAKWAMVPVGLTKVENHKCIATEYLGKPLPYGTWPIETFTSVAIAVLDALYELHFVHTKVHRQLCSPESFRTRINNVNQFVLADYLAMQNTSASLSRWVDVMQAMDTLESLGFPQGGAPASVRDVIEYLDDKSPEIQEIHYRTAQEMLRNVTRKDYDGEIEWGEFPGAPVNVPFKDSDGYFFNMFGALSDEDLLLPRTAAAAPPSRNSKHCPSGIRNKAADAESTSTTTTTTTTKGTDGGVSLVGIAFVVLLATTALAH